MSKEVFGSGQKWGQEMRNLPELPQEIRRDLIEKSIRQMSRVASEWLKDRDVPDDVRITVSVQSAMPIWYE